MVPSVCTLIVKELLGNLVPQSFVLKDGSLLIRVRKGPRPAKANPNLRISRATQVPNLRYPPDTSQLDGAYSAPHSSQNTNAVYSIPYNMTPKPPARTMKAPRSILNSSAKLCIKLCSRRQTLRTSQGDRISSMVPCSKRPIVPKA